MNLPEDNLNELSPSGEVRENLMEGISLSLDFTDGFSLMDEVNPGPLWKLVENSGVLWLRKTAV